MAFSAARTVLPVKRMLSSKMGLARRASRTTGSGSLGDGSPVHVGNGDIYAGDVGESAIVLLVVVSTSARGHAGALSGRNLAHGSPTNRERSGLRAHPFPTSRRLGGSVHRRWYRAALGDTAARSFSSETIETIW